MYYCIIGFMNKLFAHLYSFVWCLYWLQGILYPSGGVISKLLLFIIIGGSSFFFIIANLKYKLPRVLSVLSIIIISFSLYGLIAILSGESFYITESGHTKVAASSYLKVIYMSLLPIYVFYVLTKKSCISTYWLKCWTFIFLAVAIILFYRYQYEMILIKESQGMFVDGITNNAAYGILAIVCFIPLFKNNLIIQYSILAVCLFFVLIGMKRGAMVCGVVVATWYLYHMIKHSIKNRKSFKIVLLTLIIVFAALYSIDYMLISSDYFNQRLESTFMGEGSLSVREEGYSTLLSHFFNEDNPFRFLFGNGANATLKISNNYAHNDWLEIAINNGFFMLLLYLVFWVQLFRTVYHSNRETVCYLMLGSFFIIFFIRSFFSMSYADIPTWGSLALGYSLATFNHSEFH